jgi:hypothetical protein
MSSIYNNPSLIGRKQSGNYPQKGAFAAAVRSHKHNPFSWFQAKGQLPKHGPLTVPFHNVLNQQ